MRRKKQVEDWDIDMFEYLWYSVLNRHEDFYCQTPKYFFKMLDGHKKYNSPEGNDKDKKDKKKTSYVNGTEAM